MAPVTPAKYVDEMGGPAIASAHLERGASGVGLWAVPALLRQKAREGERLWGLIAIAPHGGDIERHTDQQAERARSRLGAC
jgi:hypothetical protein